MLEHWAHKLFGWYARVLYVITAVLGLSVCALQPGKWSPPGRALRTYSKFAASACLAGVWTILYKQFVMLPRTVAGLGVAMFLTTGPYVAAGCLLVISLELLRLQRYTEVRHFVVQLLQLRCKVERLLPLLDALRDRNIFAPYHFKAFAIFALIATSNLLLYYGQLVAYHLEATSWSRSLSTALTVFLDLWNGSFALLYTMALLLFDAICRRLAEVLNATLDSHSELHCRLQQRSRRYLLELYAWNMSCNRLLAPALFLYYAMAFMESLAQFYVVFAGFFGGFGDSAWNYGILLLKLLQPHLTNLLAERARLSFKHATEAVERVSYARRSHMLPEEYLLQMQTVSVGFRCGRLFCVDRALSLAFYAEICSYLIMLMQFHSGGGSA